MTNYLSTERLNHVAKSKNKEVRAWKAGVLLEKDAGVDIQKTLCRVAAARWRLAVTFRSQGNRLMKMNPGLYRSAISRYYYSMYHAVRACVYIDSEGDDHEKHDALPTHIPTNLDPNINWQTKLKDARLARNSADYDAYPAKENTWKKQAKTTSTDASSLLLVTKSFLISKGCNL